MRCTCYCTASSFDIPRLFQSLITEGPAQLFRDVVHIQMREEKKNKGDVFYFSYGVIVCWGFSDSEEKEIIVEEEVKLIKEPTKHIKFTRLKGKKRNLIKKLEIVAKIIIEKIIVENK